jgi:hypothetical protein
MAAVDWYQEETDPEFLGHTIPAIVFSENSFSATPEALSNLKVPELEARCSCIQNVP